MTSSLLFTLLCCCLAASASLSQKDATANDLLPKLEVAEKKALELDDFEGSGDEYDDDDYYYDEDDDDYEDEYDDYDGYDEASGDYFDDDDEDYRPNVISVDPDTDEDLHFVDDNNDNEILYEYYNEIFEEDDYEDLNDDDIKETSTTPNVQAATPPALNLLTSGNLLLMVASGLTSFAVFTLAFVLCFVRRRRNAAKSGKSADLPFVVDSSFMHHVGQPTSSIVKSYQRVPTSTKEFLENSNSSQYLSGHTDLNQQKDSEKPLLPE